MLVLTRRPGEQIVIGNGIRVTVVSVGPGRVKIGIEAPADVRVDRQEIHDKIQHEHASDVLAAVGLSVDAEGGTATMTLGGDTSTALPSHVAPKPVAVPKPAPVATNRLIRSRLPLKPR